MIPQALEDTIEYEEIEDILENGKRNVIYLEKQDSVTNKQAEKYVFEYREVNFYKSEIENLFQELKEALKQKKSVYLLVENKEKAKKTKGNIRKRRNYL